MITLRAIWIYPVKSLCGTRLEEAWVDDRGIAGDRRFVVVDARGRFVTQREQPSLARLVPRLDGEALAIEAPGGARVVLDVAAPGAPLEVTVWDDRVRALDAGEEAARFLGDFLGAPHRLARMPEGTVRAADPRDARPGDRVAFQDGFPFLLAGEASLAAVAAGLSAPIDMRRFRPNLVVGGAPAFAEDEWGTLRVGEVTFHARKRCPRCVVVDVDPDRGERGAGVLSELARTRTFERAARFGQNLVHDGPGRVRVGDRVILG